MKKCLEQPNKRRYNTKREADDELLSWLGVEHLRVYHCDSCNGWHLTSTPDNFKK